MVPVMRVRQSNHLRASLQPDTMSGFRLEGSTGDLVLTCQGDHGMFPVISRYPRSLGWYPDQRTQAHRDGWVEKIDNTGDVGFRWLCGGCS